MHIFTRAEKTIEITNELTHAGISTGKSQYRGRERNVQVHTLHMRAQLRERKKCSSTISNATK